MNPSTPPPRTSDAPTGSLPGASTAMARISEAPAAGAVIDRYTILERVGGGGMGEVFAAYDGKLDRKIALKLLRHRSEEYESRLMREAQAMARLSHPNVVAVFDTGRVGNKLYLAMEFVRGHTLRAWQKGASRSQADVLRVYTEAGHGLAAAHDAGLVHRDFKPDNVLIAEDGRVKVTDFGIARAQNEEASTVDGSPRATLGPLALRTASTDDATVNAPSSQATTSSTTGGLDSPMTQEGTLLGTPGYMAPEQFLCEAVDARTDQFAFCVSLYEALYGERPFAKRAASLEEIAQATLEGKLNEPPRGANVPAHLRRVILRGLAPVREERYSSMRQLLADLARDPAANRRRVAGSVAAIVAFCTLAALGVRTANARQAKLCAATDAEAAEAWNDDAAKKAEGAFLATELPYAKDTWTRTRAELDGYMAKWKAMHKQTCEATRIHGHQTEAVMTLRMSCLDQRKSEVKALAQVLGTADKDVTAKALQAAMNLTSVDACKDVASLASVVPEPTDPAKKAELKRVREGIAVVKENESAGRIEMARAEAGRVVALARSLTYAPALAQALLTSARTKAFAGAGRDECIAEALEAFERADAGRDDETRVEAASMLVTWLTDRGNIVEANRWLRVAEGVLLRSENHGIQRITWLFQAGYLADARGELDTALKLARESFDLARSTGSSPELLANTARRLAEWEATFGHKAEAERLITEAEEQVVQTMGYEHPLRLRVMVTHQLVDGVTGDLEQAVEIGKRSIALAERIAPRGESAAVGYANTCGYLSDLKQSAEALPYCLRGVQLMREVFGAESVKLALAHNNAGNAQLGLGRFTDALAHFRSALQIYDVTKTLDDPNYVETLIGEGEARLGLHDLAGAAEGLERALSRGAAMNLATPEVAQKIARAEFALTRTQWAMGRQDPRTRSLAAHAAETCHRFHFEIQAKEIEAWLAAHAK